jgi:two-component system cell cycle response regulator
MSKVLVASADARLIQRVQEVLGPLGSQGVVVGAEAEILLGVHQDDTELLLLDRRLPKLKERSFLKRLAADPLGGEVPVVLAGEFEGVEEQLELLEQGVSEFVHLPIETGLLAVRIKSMLRLARRLSKIKDQALIDELTGVFNRRYLESHLSIKFAEAKRYRHPFSFILLDLDHFKKVNDTLGHQFGDLVLRQTAALIRAQMRGEDTLTRYGGEEFAIILPHTDLEGALILAERVREGVAEYHFVQGEQQIRITVSLGIASYPENDFSNTDELISCVDARLYQAKEAGRNCLVYR